MTDFAADMTDGRPWNPAVPTRIPTTPQRPCPLHAYRRRSSPPLTTMTTTPVN